MSEYTYAHVSSKLKDFIDKIPSTGIPEKVTYNELTARGFKSTNDRSILGVLKCLHFVDAEGIPTENWNSYRNKSSNKTLLGTLIRSAYSELFAMYPEAQARTDEEIRNFIASKTKVGEDTVTRIVTTFKTLCEMADFTAADSQANTKEQELHQEQTLDEASDPVQAREASARNPALVQSSMVPVNVNIHIHLPEGDVQLARSLIKDVARYILERKMEDEV